MKGKIIVQKKIKIMTAALGLSIFMSFAVYADEINAAQESEAAVMDDFGESFISGVAELIEEHSLDEKEGVSQELVSMVISESEALSKEEAAEAVPDIRQQIVNFATQFVGRPYRYGGSSLTNGTDCSGFIMRVFENFGIATGRDSRTQAASVRKISADSMQPGDLVFYASGRRIDHVAIYIGGGQIVHASNPRTGITISNVNYKAPCMIGTFL